MDISAITIVIGQSIGYLPPNLEASWMDHHMHEEIVDHAEVTGRVQEAHPSVRVHIDHGEGSSTYHFTHPELCLSLKCSLPLLSQILPRAAKGVYLHPRENAEQVIQLATRTFQTWHHIGR